jgi:hypothetical protein
MTPTHGFRSKVDWWLILILLSILGIPMAVQWGQLTAGSVPSSLWTPMVVVAALAIAFVPIRYVIEGETVSIKCGIIGWEHSAFHVQEVLSIKESYDVLAAPALSLDRLSVDLGFRGQLLISPKDKAGFLRALAELDSRLRPENGSLIRSS